MTSDSSKLSSLQALASGHALAAAAAADALMMMMTMMKVARTKRDEEPRETLRSEGVGLQSTTRMKCDQNLLPVTVA